jgi:pyridoxal phosphate enzyme (YggS family)
MTEDRRSEIDAGLSAVRARIAHACADAGRSPEEVTLIVVTKFFPASDVRLLADLGVRHVGENRHQEAVEKAAECADLGLDWHFIGALQSNKAAAVAGYADAVHSIDRAKLLSGLSRGAQEQGRELDCVVQVSLDPPGASGRSGAPVADVPAIAERIMETEGLRLRGVMGVAPLGGDAGEAFAGLAEAAAAVRRNAPEATWISAGMSGDLEEAVLHGATHLRIGSAVLGPRPVVK